MRNLTLMAALLGVAALAGCASDSERTDSYGSGSGSASSGSAGGPSGGALPGESSIVGGTSTAGGGSIPSERVVYFDLDSSQLKPEGQAVVAAWASYLAANPGSKLRLEGHCDERGTREYNIGLGERRGNAVLQALTSQGVAASQLSVASFGEERPVSLGHDESAWAQNRRVELVQ